MNCKVCGAESGKYPLCWNCNILKEQGQIIKCTTCKQWHHKDASCPQAESDPNSNPFLYERREALLSNCEIAFFRRYTKCLTSWIPCLSSNQSGCFCTPH